MSSIRHKKSSFSLRGGKVYESAQRHQPETDTVIETAAKFYKFMYNLSEVYSPSDKSMMLLHLGPNLRAVLDETLTGIKVVSISHGLDPDLDVSHMAIYDSGKIRVDASFAASNKSVIMEVVEFFTGLAQIDFTGLSETVEYDFNAVKDAVKQLMPGQEVSLVSTFKLTTDEQKAKLLVYDDAVLFKFLTESDIADGTARDQLYEPFRSHAKPKFPEFTDLNDELARIADDLTRKIEEVKSRTLALAAIERAQKAKHKIIVRADTSASLNYRDLKSEISKLRAAAQENAAGLDVAIQKMRDNEAEIIRLAKSIWQNDTILNLATDIAALGLDEDQSSEDANSVNKAIDIVRISNSAYVAEIKKLRDEKITLAAEIDAAGKETQFLTEVILRIDSELNELNVKFRERREAAASEAAAIAALPSEAADLPAAADLTETDSVVFNAHEHEHDDETDGLRTARSHSSRMSDPFGESPNDEMMQNIMVEMKKLRELVISQNDKLSAKFDSDLSMAKSEIIVEIRSIRAAIDDFVRKHDLTEHDERVVRLLKTLIDKTDALQTDAKLRGDMQEGILHILHDAILSTKSMMLVSFDKLESKLDNAETEVKLNRIAQSAERVNEMLDNASVSSAASVAQSADNANAVVTGDDFRKTDNQNTSGGMGNLSNSTVKQPAWSSSETIPPKVSKTQPNRSTSPRPTTPDRLGSFAASTANSRARTGQR